MEPTAESVRSGAGSLTGVCVGNTRTRIGRFTAAGLVESRAFENGDATGWELAGTGAGDPVLVASVNEPVAAAIEGALRSRGARPIRLGRDLPVPLQVRVDNPESVGVDRLLNALAAYARTSRACVVIDAGTAVTVDFVNGEGVFEGGAIAPGLRLMLRALNEGTHALPGVDDAIPDPSRGPFGKDTAHAMRLGVVSAVRGMSHHLIDRYAEHNRAYPTVIATGGDALALFSGDELVEHVVPELQLLGVFAAWSAHAEAAARDDTP